METREKFKAILEREDNRHRFYKLLYKMCCTCITREFRLIIENPYSATHYLHNNFLQEPSIIDKDRTQRGDCFTKPTGYWFFGCSPTFGLSFQQPEKKLRVWDAKPAKHSGLCSEDRSMITSDYARNFICDFILGKPQGFGQMTIFDFITQ